MQEEVKRKFAVVLFIATFIACINPAHAGEEKVTPGLMCRYYDPLGTDTFFDPGGYSANGIKNVSTGTRWVSCPLVRDKRGLLSMAFISLSDNSTDCRIYRRSYEGANNYFSPSGVVEIGGWYYYTWDFSDDPLYYPDSSMAIYCRIDAGKIINSYYFKNDFAN